MLTIHKYDISNPITLPASATLLKLHYQGGSINAWYCLDTSEQETRVDKYIVIGTGWDITKLGEATYVDTLFDSGGFVWHIYKHHYE